jgi:hypothetical protein
MEFLPVFKSIFLGLTCLRCLPVLIWCLLCLVASKARGYHTSLSCFASVFLGTLWHNSLCCSQEESYFKFSSVQVQYGNLVVSDLFNSCLSPGIGSEFMPPLRRKMKDVCRHQECIFTIVCRRLSSNCGILGLVHCP